MARIVGGKEAAEREYPWQVAIVKIKSDKTRVIFCGGALLSNKYVLTAAHCQPITDKERLMIGGRWKGGIYNDDILQKMINKPKIHPLYDVFIDATLEIGIYDFMILELEKDLGLGRSNFVILPSNKFDNNFLLGKKLELSGWGSTKPITRREIIQSFPPLSKPRPLSFPNRLMSASIPFLQGYICQKRYTPMFQRHKNTESSKKTYRVKDIDFTTEPGLSTICTSSCDDENIQVCKEDDDLDPHLGLCDGDSGGA